MSYPILVRNHNSEPVYALVAPPTEVSKDGVKQPYNPPLSEFFRSGVYDTLAEPLQTLERIWAGSNLRLENNPSDSVVRLRHLPLLRTLGSPLFLAASEDQQSWNQSVDTLFEGLQKVLPRVDDQDSVSHKKRVLQDFGMVRNLSQTSEELRPGKLLDVRTSAASYLKEGLLEAKYATTTFDVFLLHRGRFQYIPRVDCRYNPMNHYASNEALKEYIDPQKHVAYPVTEALIKNQYSGDGEISIDEDGRVTSRSYRSAKHELRNDALYPGEYLTSPSGAFQLILQTDGNLVLYGRNGNAVWSTRTHGSGVTEAKMQADGNFVLYDGGKAEWATNRFAGFTFERNAVLRVNDSGSVGLYKRSGKEIVTFIRPATEVAASTSISELSNGSLFPTGVLTSPDGRFRLCFQVDGNLVLYKSDGTAQWSTKTHGQDIAEVRMQSDGNLVLYRATGGAAWATSSHCDKFEFKKNAALRLDNAGKLGLYESGGEEMIVQLNQDS